MYAVAMNKKAGTGRRGRQCRREGLERGKKRENCGYYIITSKIYKTIKAPHFSFLSLTDGDVVAASGKHCPRA